MQITAAVLLKVSEDDLLHVFEKWVECCKIVWLVKDTTVFKCKVSMFFSCQLKNEGLPYSCAQGYNTFCIGIFLDI
jgi:hypothetical protein